MNIAIIAAHPDDAEVWCGGTIYRHTSRGDKVHIFSFFQNESHRVDCAKKSAALLGASYTPQKYTNDQIDSEYYKTLENFKPEIILTHWENDSHPDHVETNKIATKSVIHLVRQNLAPRALFSFTSYHNRGRNQMFLPEFYVDISKEWEKKISAIMLHDNQYPEEIIKETTPIFQLHGNTVNCDYAEVFIEIPIFGRLGSNLRKTKFLS